MDIRTYMSTGRRPTRLRASRAIAAASSETEQDPATIAAEIRVRREIPHRTAANASDLEQARRWKAWSRH